METAKHVAMEAQALCRAAQSPQARLAATGLLADAYLQEGEFEQARRLYQQVRAEAVGSDDMLDDQSDAALGLSLIAYERNDLPAAEGEADRALDLAGRRLYNEQAVRATIMLARVWQALAGRRGRSWPCCSRKRRSRA